MSSGAVADMIAALALPAETRVERRLPKKLLLEQGAQTASDKRQIQGGIEDLVWVAALKPNNIGVLSFRDGRIEDSVADGAVWCEPVSASNSLINRERTGNFLDFSLNLTG